MNEPSCPLRLCNNRKIVNNYTTTESASLLRDSENVRLAGFQEGKSLAQADNAELDARVERVLSFLNSRGVGFEAGRDRLRNVKEASSFFTPVFGADMVISTTAINDLKRLREALLDLVSSGWKSASAHSALNAIAARSSYRLEFGSDREVHLEPVAPISVGKLLLRDVAALVEAGQWSRVKNCSNEACSATFFDQSRNRTQRWHSFEMCGNKHNVAAHRARHRPRVAG